MALVLQIDQTAPDAGTIARAAEILRAGGVAIFPTETVYGIAVCASALPDASRLFEIKKRPHDYAIPWLVPDTSALDTYGLAVYDYARWLAQAYWPGALTLVVKASDAVPKAFRAEDGTIALRAPNSPVVQALLRACCAPLVTTSANIHDCPAPSSFEQLESALREAADVVLDGGACRLGVSSSIVVCTDKNPAFGRNSALSVEELQCFLANKGAGDLGDKHM